MINSKRTRLTEHVACREGNMYGNDHLENLAIDGRTIKMAAREVGWKNVDEIYLSQDRDQWQGVVNMVMNFRLHRMHENS
jgi:hypothetical protein